MTSHLPSELNKPWWARHTDRYNDEARRFEKEFDPPFTLLNHPETYNNPKSPDYARGRVSWRGHVDIRVGNASTRKEIHQKYLVDFVYPETYPFERIKVYPFCPEVRDSRHQDPNEGYICYLPYVPDGWNPSITNAQVLDKVIQWFEGYATDWQLGRHIDVPEPEAYFRTDIESYSVFLLDHAYSISSGSGYMDLRLDQKQRRAALIAIKNLYTGESSQLDEICNSVVEQLLGSAETIKNGFWFDVSVPPHRQLSATQVCDHILAHSIHSDEEVHRRRLVDLMMSSTKKLSVCVGLRFEYQGRKQWTILELTHSDNASKKQRRGKKASRPGKMDITVRAMRACPIRVEDIFHRLNGVYSHAELEDKKVVFVGSGALGSPAASLLAKAGVMKFHIFDGDIVGVGNLLRQEYGVSHLGKIKAEAMTSIIHEINPYATITTDRNVRNMGELAEAIQDAHLVIAATGNENNDLLVNYVAVRLGITVLYVRAMRKMQVGRIIRVIPGTDACISCLCSQPRSMLADIAGEPYIDIRDDDADVIYDDGCGSATVPGAAIDTEETANLLARIAVDLLLGKQEQHNHWVWVCRGNLESDDFRLREDLTYTAQCFKPITGCQECGGNTNTAEDTHNTEAEDLFLIERRPWHDVVILDDAIDTIQQESERVGELETGGILLGSITNGKLIVTNATGPGPASVHQTHYFLRDASYCQAALDRIHAESGGKIDYVGEWHKHVAFDSELSPTDRASLLAIACSSKYAVSHPAMILCEMPNHRVPDRVKLRVFGCDPSTRMVSEFVLPNQPKGSIVKGTEAGDTGLGIQVVQIVAKKIRRLLTK